MGRKVCFLFGAGAEGHNNFNLPTGHEFILESFLSENTKNTLLPELKRVFSSKYYNNRYEYTQNSYYSDLTFKSILKKWIIAECKDEKCYQKYENDIRIVLNKDEHKELIDSIGITTASKEKERDITKEEIEKFSTFYKELYCTDKEAKSIEFGELSIANLFVNDKGKAKGDLPTGIAHILDSHFHTIIDPTKYGKVKFSKVFNYYWSIFFAIFKPIYEMKNEDLNPKEAFSYDFDSLLDKVNFIYNDSGFDEKIKRKDRQSYYRCIKSKFESDELCGAITTNYFDFAERILETEVAYINGQLKLFEVPETLEVIDITEVGFPSPKEKIYFPFIFGQSYTKPIVSKHQIDAFTKMKGILEEANVLVILGYNINEDDNHLNSFLREFIMGKKEQKNGNKIIVVNDRKDCSETKRKLRVDLGEENIIHCKVNYSCTTRKIVDQIFQTLRNMPD